MEGIEEADDDDVVDSLVDVCALNSLLAFMFMVLYRYNTDTQPFLALQPFTLLSLVLHST